MANREYYLKNRDRIRSRTKEYRLANLDKSRGYSRKYYLKNRDLVRRRAKEWRIANPDRVSIINTRAKAKVSVHVREIRRRNLAVLSRYKRMKGCHACGFRNPVALDFHHRSRETKRFNVSRCGSRNWNLIKEEVGKCTILCANCHRLVEAGILVRG